MKADLILYYHPLSSFCQKALIALYEHGAPFQPRLVDLRDPQERAALCRLWPIGKFPVLEDHARGEVVAESSIVIEYLDQHYRGAAPLIPADPAQALRARHFDRVFDLYVHLPMQKIVGDRMRPEAAHDPHGVEEAKATLRTAYALIDREMVNRSWVLGESYSLADCSASPALGYADMACPIGKEYPHTARYLERLRQRPSYARALREAEPYLHMVP
ncbi:MAG TPA: glutathione S-transferase family protein, partial [Nevskia sp.]|nr:glutathione S-transferase family protein [Nevskia sp.]